MFGGVTYGGVGEWLKSTVRPVGRRRVGRVV